MVCEEHLFCVQLTHSGLQVEDALQQQYLKQPLTQCWKKEKLPGQLPLQKAYTAIGSLVDQPSTAFILVKGTIRANVDRLLLA